METQMTFKRYELKYILSRKQKRRLLEEMEAYMKLDGYGRSTIRNLYYDTPQFRLVRRSNEKPVYKEKLRVRSYQRAGAEDKVFVELKKKYEDVVYKRRIALPQKTALDWLAGGRPLLEKSGEYSGKHRITEGEQRHLRIIDPWKGGTSAGCTWTDRQITKEIEYFCRFYQTLSPAVFLAYEREAYYALDGSDFRVTFDEAICYRQKELTLDSAVYGMPLLKPDETLMEIKTSRAIPLWMVRFLSKEKIYKTSFSKYGEAYRKILSEAKASQKMPDPKRIREVIKDDESIISRAV